MTKIAPRGIRNHNPGNIDFNPKVKWQNLDDPPTDGRFCRFKTAPDGIRALCRVLITYQDKRQAADGSKIDTVREIVERWAPPVENDTSAYAAAVRRSLGLDGPEQEGEIDVHQYECMKPLVKAIIKHENGQQPYTDAQIATVGTAGAGSVGVLVDQVKDAADQISPLAYYSKWIMLGFVALTMIGIGLTVWARYDDRRKGLR